MNTFSGKINFVVLLVKFVVVEIFNNHALLLNAGGIYDEVFQLLSYNET